MTLKDRFAARCTLAAGALLGAAPAFGATFDLRDLLFTPNDYALGALLLVLIVSLAVSLSRGHSTTTEAMPEEPDMRWWKNAHSNQ